MKICEKYLTLYKIGCIITTCQGNGVLKSQLDFGTLFSFCQRKWKRVHKNDERNRNENTMCTRIFWMSGL